MVQEDRELQRAENQRVTEQRRQSEALFVPRADILETQDALIVIADMPGVDEKSVDIQVERNLLTISGRTEAESYEGFQLGYQEFETGQFARQFALSDEVDVNRIEASVRNGVLEIRLPKVESVKPRKITVRAG
ncbi:MAG: Hsp20/alpha crystallin family protein [Candidatus Riflebacteria bacterium]|nr:Hsp20/alpha crystallin family protein [Candidatus Riflebacteria bacterium]